MKQLPIPVPILKKPYEAPFLPRNICEDRFDPEHCQRAAPGIERLISNSYRSIVLSEESKKKILDLVTSSILYASLHKSHLDHIVICGKMLLEGLPCPRTIGGSNLLTGIIGRSVKQFTGIDMMKWGAVPLKRGPSVSHELPYTCTQIEAFLGSNKPVLVFPEIESSVNGNGKSIRTGRAYSEKIRKFASSLFSPAINVSKKGEKVYIVPIAVSYDFVAEDNYFVRLAKAANIKKSENPLVFFAGKLYYTFLESHFFYNLYNLGRGNIYIDIGQPILVEPNASKKELAESAYTAAAKSYRITMPALVSYAISRGATTKDELKKSVERYAMILKETKANFHTTLGLDKSVEVALQ